MPAMAALISITFPSRSYEQTQPGECCENSGSAARTNANWAEMAMALLSSGERRCLPTTMTALAGCPAWLPSSLFPAHRLSLGARDRPVQDDREERKKQTRTLDHKP